MAEQRLDVKVTENGTAVVTSKLDKLDEKLAQLTKTGEAQAASAAQMAGALDKVGAANERLVSFLDKTNSKMAAVEKVAGVLAKVNLAWQLVTTAVKFAADAVDKYILGIKALGPALDTINTKLQRQSDIIKGMIDVRTRIIALGGTITEATQGAAMSMDIQQREARLAELVTESERRGVTLGAAERINARLATEEANRRATGGSLVAQRGSVLTPEEAQTLKDAATGRTQEEIQAEASRIQNDLVGARLDLAKLEADINKRETGGGGGGGGGGAGPRLPSGGAQLGQLEGGGLDTATFGEGIGQLETVLDTGSYADAADQIDNLALAWDAAASSAEAFADASVKSSLAAAGAAILAGENAFAAVQQVLEARALEAGVDALFATGKFFLTDNPKYLQAAELMSAVAVAATAGSAVAGALAGGGGGGRASAGAAPPAESDFGPRREDSRAEQPLTINIYNDPMSREQFGGVVLDGLEAAGQSAGMRGRVHRVLRGGGY